MDVVVLNAGTAIYLVDKADSIMEGVEMARESLMSGAAWEKMTKFVDFTQQARVDLEHAARAGDATAGTRRRARSTAASD
jgi:thymidine phosphorylase